MDERYWLSVLKDGAGFEKKVRPEDRPVDHETFAVHDVAVRVLRHDS